MGCEGLSIKTLQTGHIILHNVAQPGPVKGCARNIPAKPIRLVQILCKMRPINEHFFWDTAAYDAGSAYSIFFCDRHFCAVGRRYPGGSHAAGTGPDYKEIKIIFCHILSYADVPKARLISVLVDGSIAAPSSADI